MGVIYGYISLTDKPVDPAIAETMRKANSFWNPDGDELFTCEHAALGSLILFNTPEAIFEKQPIYFEDNRKVMVATARIDNRDDLCRVFNIPLSARDTYPDSYYIRLAYEKWGEACSDHIIGDWSFAVYDKLARKLFIARDHHGIMACYYYQGPDFFVFSSSLKGILCLPQVEKKVNEYKIAQILVNWYEGNFQTSYQNIYRLPPAHTLLLDNKRVSTNRFWYVEHIPEIRLKNDREYADMFYYLYNEAVRCRLRSYRPIGITLSGGVDSGSVCILAAQELAKYGKRLPAFTAVPLYDVSSPKNRIGNEGPLALELAKKMGNVDLTLCNSETINPLEGIISILDCIDEPGYSVKNAFWIIDLLKQVQGRNIGTLLTGQFGNYSISWQKPSLKRALLSGFLPQSFLFKQRILKSPLINTTIFDSVNIQQLYKPSTRTSVFEPAMSRFSERWFTLGLKYGSEIRDPTIDIALIKFIFGITKNNKYYNTRLLLKRKILNVF